MGKRSDKLYMRASEHASSGGGSAAAHRYATGVTSASGAGAARPLPFDCCALTLQPFVNPVASPEGVVFEASAIVPYLKDNPVCPSTGRRLERSDLITLEMCKEGGEWVCPVTLKKFTDQTKACFIRNQKPCALYSYAAVNDLCLKPKSLIDLTTGVKFKRSDIVITQDPSDPEVCRRRDISSFKFLAKEHKKGPSVRASEGLKRVLNEMEAKGPLSSSLPEQAKEASIAEEEHSARPKLLTSDLPYSATLTTGAAASSLTSTSGSGPTGPRHASRLEVEDSICAHLRKKKGRKSYVLLPTSLGAYTLELDSDTKPLTCLNFLTLARRGKYDGLKFHRVVKGFIAQTGDPTGTGSGGSNIWNTTGIPDDLTGSHVLGSVSMANAGPGTGKSQFFLCLRDAPHLDGRHDVFGRVVSGDVSKFDGVDTDKKDRPREAVKLGEVKVIEDRVWEATEFVYGAGERRLKEEAKKAKEAERRKTAAKGNGGGGADDDVGKYIKRKAQEVVELPADGAGGEEWSVPEHAKKKKKAGGFGNFSGW